MTDLLREQCRYSRITLTSLAGGNMYRRRRCCRRRRSRRQKRYDSLSLGSDLALLSSLPVLSNSVADSNGRIWSGGYIVTGTVQKVYQASAAAGGAAVAVAEDVAVLVRSGVDRVRRTYDFERGRHASNTSSTASAVSSAEDESDAEEGATATQLKPTPDSSSPAPLECPLGMHSSPTDPPTKVDVALSSADAAINVESYITCTSV